MWAKSVKVFKSKEWQEKVSASYDVLLKQWNTPVEQIEVPTTYGSTHVNVFGKRDGKPLVLFHGVGDNSALMWIYNAAALAEHFCVYSIDTIGGPGKSVPNDKYDKDFGDAKWIDEVLDYFGLKDVNIAGVSNGGYLTQYYTLMRSERVKKAMAMASGIPTSSGLEMMKIMMKIFMPEALFPTEKNVRKLLMKLAGKNHAVFTENHDIFEHYRCLLKGFNNMAMGNHKIIKFSDKQIAQIKGKCMYLMGEEDPFAKMGARQLLEKYDMNAAFFPITGHGINHEISAEVNARMIEYFS